MIYVVSLLQSIFICARLHGISGSQIYIYMQSCDLYTKPHNMIIIIELSPWNVIYMYQASNDVVRLSSIS